MALYLNEFCLFHEGFKQLQAFREKYESLTLQIPKGF